MYPPPPPHFCPRAIEIKLFGRDIPGFCWDIPAVPEKFENKESVFNFWPLALGDPKSRFQSPVHGFESLVWGRESQHMMGCWAARFAPKSSARVMNCGHSDILKGPKPQKNSNRSNIGQK